MGLKNTMIISLLNKEKHFKYFQKLCFYQWKIGAYQYFYQTRPKYQSYFLKHADASFFYPIQGLYVCEISL